MKRRPTTKALLASVAIAALVYGLHETTREQPASSTPEQPEEMVSSAARAGAGREMRAAGRSPRLSGAAPTSRQHEGHITGPDGDPASGALVCASCVGCDLAPRCTRTDAEGRYHLEAMHGAKPTLSVSAPGMAPRLVEQSGSKRDRDAELERGGATVSGVVVDSMGGVVAGAEVRVLFPLEGQSAVQGVQHATVTDEEGAFQLDVIRGNVHLTARAEGYAPGERSLHAPARGVVLNLVPGASIRGTVVTASDGTPVADVRVTPRGALAARQFAVSNERGEFVLQGLRAGRYMLEAEGAGYRGQLQGVLGLDVMEQAEGIVLPVIGGSPIHAEVRGADGSPCEDGRVVLVPSVPGTAPRLTAVATESRADIEAAPPGTYEVLVRCTGFTPLTTRLEVGDDPVRPTWTLEPGLALTVRAVDLEGRPVAGAHLMLTAQGADNGSSNPGPGGVEATNAEGLAEFAGMPQGTYSVYNRYLTEPVQVALTAGNNPATVDAVLKPVGTLEVAVRDADGAPVGGVTVSCDSLDGTPGALGSDVGDGRHSIGPIAVGSYRVEVDDGRNPVVSRLVGTEGAPGIVPGETTEIEIRLPPRNGTIHGRVVDASGAPVSDLVVTARRAQDREDAFYGAQQDALTFTARETLTGLDGEFTLGDLVQDATFVVQARRDADGSVVVAEGARPGEPLQLVFSLDAAGEQGSSQALRGP